MNMDQSAILKEKIQPKPIAELLPDLALNSKDAILTLTAKKKPRNTMAVNRTAEKAVRPLTIAEIRAEIQAFKIQTPGRPQAATSTRKKGWNSSVKVDKKVNHTGNGKMCNNVVRKVLNFQPSKPAPPKQTKPVTNTRMTMVSTVSHSRMALSSDTPKFPKPEQRAKKALYTQAKSNVRISGICKIPETPVDSKPTKPRITIANKENSSYSANINKKSTAPTVINHERLAPPFIPDTPVSNDSWKSGSDASFIQREKEIHETEQITNAILDAQHTLENIAEVSPPVSTPFRAYRQDMEHSNNSSIINTSNGENDTLVCFDNPTMTEKTNVREESVIVSLCDMLNKACVSKNKTPLSKLDELMEEERQMEQNIKMIHHSIQMLTKIKQSQQKSLEQLRKRINEKRDSMEMSENDNNTTLKDGNPLEKFPQSPKNSPERSPMLGRRCSVITTSPKSPSYKIPKKTCLRKKVFYKSMPNVISDMSTPVKLDEGKALNMYMKMKQKLNFLNTPLVKSRPAAVPDTPAVTSHNLKVQLNKLYGS